MSAKNNYEYVDNSCFANSFREQQQDLYNNRSENNKKFSQESYSNNLDYKYLFVDNQQQQSRQTQFFIIYQFNNFSYQNRAYQNQSNYRFQQQRSSQVEIDQLYERNLSQSSSQNQLYRFVELMSSASFQLRNAFGLQLKSQQSSQPYRPPNDGYLGNQYQNRSLYDQRSNMPAIQQGQRAYLTENDPKYYHENTF